MEEGWKVVYLTTDEYKAEIANDLLENEGVKGIILNQHDSGLQNFGNFCIYVAQNDESRAVEILKSLIN